MTRLVGTEDSNCFDFPYSKIGANSSWSAIVYGMSFTPVGRLDHQKQQGKVLDFCFFDADVP